MRKTTRFNEHATLQFALSARKLSNEILLLSWINMVSSAAIYIQHVSCTILISFRPQLSYVAEDDKGNIVGYVLAKMEEVSHKFQ